MSTSVFSKLRRPRPGMSAPARFAAKLGAMLGAAVLLAPSAPSVASAQSDVDHTQDQINQSCIICGCCNGPTTGGGAPLHYTAIAISNSNITLWGDSWGYGNRAAAERAAEQSCSKYARDCKVLIWGEGRCLALAETPNGSAYGYDLGLTPESAEAGAVRHCESVGKGQCRIIIHPCSED